MRLWTIHPKYLDAKGLVAVWREGLLAQKVLQGKTKGYRHHPQLVRFQAQPAPTAAIATYLVAIATEATARGYAFDSTKIADEQLASAVSIEETTGQMMYEWQHLLHKLQERDPQRFQAWGNLAHPDPHPLFTLVAGPVRDWERIQPT